MNKIGVESYEYSERSKENDRRDRSWIGTYRTLPSPRIPPHRQIFKQLILPHKERIHKPRLDPLPIHDLVKADGILPEGTGMSTERAGDADGRAGEGGVGVGGGGREGGGGGDGVDLV